jgi:hypothetical protein
MNIAKTSDAVSASLSTNGKFDEAMEIHGEFTAECIDPNGTVKWTEKFNNLVTTEGKNHLLNNGLSGPATAVSARMALITSGTPVIGDTYASHAGWSELGSGVVTARGTPTFSAASAGVKATSSAVSYAIVGTGIVTGAAILLVVGAVGNLGVVADTATSGGINYSGGLFGSSKSVTSGDTLNVTYSSTLT